VEGWHYFNCDERTFASSLDQPNVYRVSCTDSPPKSFMAFSDRHEAPQNQG